MFLFIETNQLKSTFRLLKKKTLEFNYKAFVKQTEKSNDKCEQLTQNTQPKTGLEIGKQIF